MRTNEIEQSLKVGDKVTFDNDKIDSFRTETNIDNNAIQKYRKIVLAGIDQVGVVKELGGTMTVISYPDGWDVPIPTKYLRILPSFN